MKKLMIAAAVAALAGVATAGEQCEACGYDEAVEGSNPAFYNVQFKLNTLVPKKVNCGGCEGYCMEKGTRTLDGILWTCENCNTDYPYQLALWEKKTQTQFTDDLYYGPISTIDAKYVFDADYMISGNYIGKDKVAFILDSTDIQKKVQDIIAAFNAGDNTKAISLAEKLILQVGAPFMTVAQNLQKDGFATVGSISSINWTDLITKIKDAAGDTAKVAAAVLDAVNTLIKLQPGVILGLPEVAGTITVKGGVNWDYQLDDGTPITSEVGYYDVGDMTFEGVLDFADIAKKMNDVWTEFYKKPVADIQKIEDSTKPTYVPSLRPGEVGDDWYKGAAAADGFVLNLKIAYSVLLANYKVSVKGIEGGATKAAAEQAAIDYAKTLSVDGAVAQLVPGSVVVKEAGKAEYGECVWQATENPIQWYRFSKKADKVEAFLAFEGDTINLWAAGFGSYDTKNHRAKNVSGQAVGMIDPTDLCGDQGNILDFCEDFNCGDTCWDGTGIMAELENTFFTGTWTVKLNMGLTKKKMTSLVPSWYAKDIADVCKDAK